MSQDVTSVEKLIELLWAREVCVRHLTTIVDMPRSMETHVGGIKLGLSDWLIEEVIILEEIKYILEGDVMPTDQETRIYFEARDRAIGRNIGTYDLEKEVMEGFARGLAASDPSFADTEADDSSIYLPRIKTETNFAFGFICGVLARLEAVKGKHYAGSWQKRGESVVLANVQRKVDRLDQLITTDSKAGENLSQTLGDNAVYAVKWLSLRAELSPEEFKAWVKEVQGL